MIILALQWYDEWSEEWIQLSHIISWWYNPPMLVFYASRVEVYGDAHLLMYDDGTSYSMRNKYLDARLEREIQQYVFTSF